MNTSYAYLVCVDSKKNCNKFYEITLNNDRSIDVSYGRVGAPNPSKKHYEPHQRDFYGLLDEKLRKGYEDVTALHSEVKAVSPSATEEANAYKAIDDNMVQELMDLFIKSSREFMKTNYTIKAQNITPKMIEEADNDLKELNRIALENRPDALYFFNKRLEQLFTDVPRAMSKVELFLAKKESDFDKILQRETDMLDNLKGIVNYNKSQKQADTDKDKTVLEAHGLTARQVTYKEEDQIMAHLGRDYNNAPVEDRFVRAFAVENLETRAAYEKYKQQNNITAKGVRLFYHGSKVENFYSILKQGLLLHPNASVTGKMFGQGIYFAPECRKALNYMDVAGAHWNNGSRDTGYCAIFAVALGKCYKPDHILHSSFTGKDLPAGTNSVFASKKDPRLGLQNDEYIVYDEAACTVKYIMEMSKKDVRKKVYNIDRDNFRDKLDAGLETLVKTPTGFRTEVMLENLDKNVVAEINTKITDSYDCNRLYIDYNTKRDTISFSIETTNGDHADIYPTQLTRDDYSFIMREIKKAFVESEKDWKELVDKSADLAVGKTVITKKEAKEEKDIKKNNKDRE